MDNLKFKDFASNPTDINSSASTNSNIEGNLLDGPQSTNNGGDDQSKPHFLTLQFYQRFFDIDEDTVLTRILQSAFPTGGNANFVVDFVQPNPDLWGPFWISTTLVFSIAIVGNFANFLNYYSSTDQQYSSDFSFVISATFLVFGYILLLPSLIYSFLWYRPNSTLQYSFFDLLSSYGYSLALFIPASIVCPLLPFNSARWAFILIPAISTAAVLIISIWPCVKDDPNRLSSFCFIVAVFAAHLIFAFSLKEFYFDVTAAIPSSPDLVIPSISPPNPTNNSSSLSG